MKRDLRVNYMGLKSKVHNGYKNETGPTTKIQIGPNYSQALYFYLIFFIDKRAKSPGVIFFL
jgi:hypothetical protein